MEGCCIAEGKVKIEPEYSRTTWPGVVVVIEMSLGIVAGGSLLGMVWFARWKGRLELYDIVWVDLG